MARNRGAAARYANRTAIQGAASERLRGMRSFRKLLRQLPSSVRDGMGDILDQSGAEYLAAMKADVPVASGALRDGLRYKLLRKSLRLRIGILSKPLMRKLFYARPIEFGRKASNKKRSSTMAARPFVLKQRPSLRARLNARLNRMWGAALLNAAIGAGDD